MGFENIWLLSLPDPMTLPNSLKLKINSQVYSYNFQENSSLIELKEAYRVADHLKIKTNPVGLWSQKTGLFWTTVYFWERRSDLDGITFSCATEAVS